MAVPPFLCSFDNASPFAGWTGGQQAIVPGRTIDGNQMAAIGGTLYKTFGVTYSSISMGCSYKTNGYSNPIVYFGKTGSPSFDGIGVKHFGDGRVRFVDWGPGTPIGDVSNGLIIPKDVWINLQFQILTQLLVSGSYQIVYNALINGMLVCSYATTAATAPAFNSLNLLAPGGGSQCIFDNVWCDWIDAALWGDLTVNPDDATVEADNVNIRSTQHGIEILAAIPEYDLNLVCPVSSTGYQNFSYSQFIIASGGTPPYSAYSITAGSLPTGLSLNSATGEISGIPTVTGTFWFTESVTDSTTTTVEINCAITILSGGGSICPLAAATVGEYYNSYSSVMGGVPPYTWEITAGALPTGLSLNSTTGQIFGTPLSQGTYPFTITVTDAEGSTSSDDCSIVVQPNTPETCIVAPSPAYSVVLTIFTDPIEPQGS